MKKHFKSETIVDIVGYIKNADESKLDSCVERKIKILADENPKWDQDQVVAVAFDMCRESGSLDNLILDVLRPEIMKIREKVIAQKNLESEVEKLNDKLQVIKT